MSDVIKTIDNTRGSLPGNIVIITPITANKQTLAPTQSQPLLDQDPSGATGNAYYYNTRINLTDRFDDTTYYTA